MLGGDLVPWLCWIFPTIGGALALLFDRISRTLRDLTATTLSLMGWIMAILMIPDLFATRMMDQRVFWIRLPGGASVEMGMLVDPLSVILANVVAFLGFITLVYSIKYMEEGSSQSQRRSSSYSSEHIPYMTYARVGKQPFKVSLEQGNRIPKRHRYDAEDGEDH